jgi:protein dithiol:quinone oxidoreductase
MKSVFVSPRAPFIAVAVACLGLVGGGIVMSEFWDLAACPLCIIQRMAYLALAAMAALSLPFALSPTGRRVGGLLMALPAATGAFVAGYQTWIQRFSPTTGCSGRMTWWEEFVDWAGSEIPLLFRADGACSDPGWKFLGLSIAEWSLVCFSAFFLFSLYTLLRRR